MKCKILLFAVLAEIAQTHQIEMEVYKKMELWSLFLSL